MNFSGQVYDAESEAIIDVKTWDRVQGLLDHGAKGLRRRSTRSHNLLAGIVRCTPCNAAYTYTYSQKGRVRFRYLVCGSAHRRGHATCPGPMIPATQIEKFVIDRTRAIGQDPELVTRTVEETGKQLAARKAELEAEARRLQKDLDRAHDDVRREIEAVSGEGKPRRRVSSRHEAIGALEDRLAAVRDELEVLRALRIDADDLRAALATFDPLWETLTTVAQARMAHTLIERIEYDGRNGNLDITFRATGVRLLATEGHQAEEAGA